MKMLALATAAVALALVGCSDPESGSDPDLSFDRVEGFYGIGSPATVVFHTVEEWNAFYEERRPGQTSVPSVPADLDREMLIGLYYGTVAGCPQRVETIERVALESGEVVVHVTALPHLGDCEAALFAAFDLIRMDRRDEPLSFAGPLPPTEW